MDGNGGERARLFRVPGVAGVEVLHARFVTYRYARHFHEAVTIAVVDQGAAGFSSGRRRYQAGAGSLFVIPALEVHTGEAAADGGYAYRVLYVDPSVLAELLREIGPAAGPASAAPAPALTSRPNPWGGVTVDTEDLRLAVYDGFVDSGRAPTAAALARRLGVEPEELHDSLRLLDQQRHLVLDPDGEIVMAHPFSAVPLGFAVMGSATLWWGGCAWDSFAMPHVLRAEPEVLVSTRCPGCGAALAWVVGREQSPAGGELAHFLVPAAQHWDDVVHTCGNQRLFCGQRCIDAWLERTGNRRGYVLDLATLWRLAAHWYDGRLERGYRRREPEVATDYFRSVGLEGAFWGL